MRNKKVALVGTLAVAFDLIGLTGVIIVNYIGNTSGSYDNLAGAPLLTAEFFELMLGIGFCLTLILIYRLLKVVEKIIIKYIK
jgi:hypothetical protein